MNIVSVIDLIEYTYVACNICGASNLKHVNLFWFVAVVRKVFILCAGDAYRHVLSFCGP